MAAEALLEACEIALSVGIVLIEDADLGAVLVGENVLAVEKPFARVVRLPTHRERLGSRADVRDRVERRTRLRAKTPERVAGGQKHLRHLVAVEVTHRG